MFNFFIKVFFLILFYFFKWKDCLNYHKLSSFYYLQRNNLSVGEFAGELRSPAGGAQTGCGEVVGAGRRPRNSPRMTPESVGGGRQGSPEVPDRLHGGEDLFHPRLLKPTPGTILRCPPVKNDPWGALQPSTQSQAARRTTTGAGRRVRFVQVHFILRSLCVIKTLQLCRRSQISDPKN